MDLCDTIITLWILLHITGLFSTSFVMNSLDDSWLKLKEKYTCVNRLKWSPRDTYKEGIIHKPWHL